MSESQIEPQNVYSCDAALQLWAKSMPYKQLLSHMLDTGCCAYQFLSAESSRSILEFLMEQWSYNKEAVCTFVAYLASMHDIGKAMPWFQRNDESQYERLIQHGLTDLFPEKYLEPIQHEYISSRIFKRIWKQRNNQKQICDSYAAVLALHHQRCNSSQTVKIPGIWQELQDELELEALRRFPVPDKLPHPANMDATCILLSGLIVLCDWVASSGPFDDIPEVNDHYISSAMHIAKDALIRYGLISNHSPVDIDSFHSLWPQISNPRDIQKRCDELSFLAPITIIEAPMGEGKTEAALYLAERLCNAWNKRGIYVALPTQATSNQMFGRTKVMLDRIEGGNTRLLHGTAFLQNDDKSIQIDDKEERFEAERWLGSLRMGLLDENGVGTVDQAMAGVLKARFSILRLLGLTNKVLIVDELHAYDAYMSEIIQSLLRWCKALRIPIVLLSATLQESQRKAYLSCYTDNKPSLSLSYPLITQVDDSGHLTQIEASATMETIYHFAPVCFGDDCDTIAKFAIDQLSHGGCYCILVNTVRKAQRIYQSLLDLKNDDTETILFHARFPMGRREEIEKECLSKFGKGQESVRPQRAILVATQVVEQSLDLDFDGMLTELAPIDLLLQRAGRVHRHRDRIRPEGMGKPIIHVILPDENAVNDYKKRYRSSGYVYAPFLLSNTESIVKNGRTVLVPSDVRTIIEEAYAQVTPENLKAWQEMEFAQELMKANADGNRFPDPKDEVFFPTQSHPEFVGMDIDDGFEPAMHVTTRLGEPTFRIAFSNSVLMDAAKTGQLSKEQQQKIFLSSVALSMNRITIADLEASELYRIEKSKLKGCYITDHYDKIQIGKKLLINDQTLGVMWKE